MAVVHIHLPVVEIGLVGFVVEIEIVEPVLEIGMVESVVEIELVEPVHEIGLLEHVHEIGLVDVMSIKTKIAALAVAPQSLDTMTSTRSFPLTDSGSKNVPLFS